MRSLPFIVDRVVLRVSAELADNVRDALRASINIDEIIDAFLATFPSDTPTRSQARDWARMNVRQNEKPLDKVLEDVYASGWVLGTDYATEAMRLASIKKAPTFTIDWSKWKPGQPAAEAIVRPPNGLKRLLRRYRRQTIKGISDTNLSRIGTVLADGLAVGADSRSVARELMALAISGIMDDANRAMTIAITEASRAVGAATLERYQEMGLRLHEWITVEGEGVCEACDENAMAGPIAVGDEFPSGDLHEPAHPNCRCKMAPFIEGFSTPVREDVELGATALKFVDGTFITKFDKDQPRDEAGRFSSDGSNGGGAEPTDAQYAALDFYLGDGYIEINSYLRKNDPIGFNRLAIANQVSLIDEMMKPSEEPRTLYRGMYLDTTIELFRNLEPGDQFTDKGFISTSESETFAKNWATSETLGIGLLMVIDAPAGTSSVKIDDLISGVNEEQEVILQRDTTFEVVSNSDNRMEVKVVR